MQIREARADIRPPDDEPAALTKARGEYQQRSLDLALWFVVVGLVFWCLKPAFSALLRRDRGPKA